MLPTAVLAKKTTPAELLTQRPWGKPGAVILAQADKRGIDVFAILTGNPLLKGIPFVIISVFAN